MVIVVDRFTNRKHALATSRTKLPRVRGKGVVVVGPVNGAGRRVVVADVDRDGAANHVLSVKLHRGRRPAVAKRGDESRVRNSPKKMIEMNAYDIVMYDTVMPNQ